MTLSLNVKNVPNAASRLGESHELINNVLDTGRISQVTSDLRRLS